MTELVKHEQQEATTVAETQLQEEIEPLFMRQARPYTGILNVLSVALALVMFGSMLLMCLVVNIGEIIGWLTSFVNPRLGNKINTLFAGIGFFYFASLIEQFSGVSVEISGDNIPNYENAICISNHVADTDFILVVNYAYRKGMLGHAKYMAKNSIRYIPFLGWGMHILHMIFLTRNWDTDKQKILNTFKVLRDQYIPVWLVSFLEGTRITPEKLTMSQVFAKSKNYPEFKHIMLPRMKGFIAMIQGLKNSHVKCIYDFTFGYVDGVFSFRDFLGKNLRGVKLCINVKRYSMDSIPMESEETIAQWLLGVWERKERLLRGLAQVKHTKRRFPGEPLQNEPLRLLNWNTVPYQQQEQALKSIKQE